MSAALRKLVVLDAAEALDDLRVPPGNRLEKPSGDRAGQYGIRINDRWCTCFRWRGGDAYDVEIVNYHGVRRGSWPPENCRPFIPVKCSRRNS